MALDTSIEIEDEHELEIAKVCVGGVLQKIDDDENKLDVDDIHIQCNIDDKRNESNEELRIRSDCLVIEEETLFDKKDQELVEAFIYKFKLSDNQIIMTDFVVDENDNGDIRKDKKPVKQSSIDSDASMDDAIKRVLAKVSEIKIQRRNERKKRERLKCLHLVIAIIMILLFALAVVGIRVRRFFLCEFCFQVLPFSGKIFLAQ